MRFSRKITSSAYCNGFNKISQTLRLWDPCDFEEKAPINCGTETRNGDSVKIVLVDNLISKLGVYCSKLKLMAPHFEDIGHEVYDNNRHMFKVRCKIYGVGAQRQIIDATGDGNRKQTAKNNAAAAMYAKLEELDLIGDVFKKTSKERENNGEKLEENNEENAEEVKQEQVLDKSVLHEYIKSKSFTNKALGECMTEISRVIEAKEIPKYLDQIAKLAMKLKLRVEYNEIDPSLVGNEPKNHRCCLHLKKVGSYDNIPILSVWGSNHSMELAKCDAAFRALKMFAAIW